MNKSRKNRAYYISRVLIISPVYMGICFNKKQFKNECKRLKVPKNHIPDFICGNSDATTHIMKNYKTNNVVCLVCVQKNKNKTEMAGLITHEAVHIWHEIKDKIGEKYPSAEFEAMCIQSIMQKLFRKERKVM